MKSASLNLGPTGSEELIARKPDFETPEFDITAMVDLVFMMNIYFLVTFVSAAVGLNLPAARHVAAFDGDTAVILTIMRSLDGKGATVYIGGDTEGEPISDPDEQERRIQAAVEQGIKDQKTAVLLKAEKKVRMEDFFRIASLACAPQGDEGKRLTLHDAVMEKEE
jgi:biopolymer transport protein ExbD